MPDRRPLPSLQLDDHDAGAGCGRLVGLWTCFKLIFCCSFRQCTFISERYVMTNASFAIDPIGAESEHVWTMVGELVLLECGLA